MLSYEIRVDHTEGTNVVKIDAATITEAVQRASRIFRGTTETTLLCMVDRAPQKYLAGYAA